jgi:hypothetical protein
VAERTYAKISKKYTQSSVSKRIEALFLDNIGKVIMREQILQVARDPSTGKVPENWHQRLSELRTDMGYTILTKRDNADLKVSEYLMLSAERRDSAAKRVRLSSDTWMMVLERAGGCCQWNESGELCGMKEGEVDAIGGGTVRLTPDHRKPHSVNPSSDPTDVDAWRPLCGRHQVMKKNFWDDASGWLNVYAIVQAASKDEKRAVLRFLISYFGVQEIIRSATPEEKRLLLEMLR